MGSGGCRPQPATVEVIMQPHGSADDHPVSDEQSCQVSGFLTLLVQSLETTVSGAAGTSFDIIFDTESQLVKSELAE